MAGRKLLRKIQLGRESSAGTAVAATTVWGGMGTIEDQREVKFVEEDIGYLSGVDRTYTPKYLAAISFDEVEATFEQLPHVLEAGVKTVTPSQDGTGSGYIYSYDFPTTADNTIKTYTIEGGDDQQAEEMEYSFVESFSISGAAEEGVMVGADWLGRQVTDVSFTGSQSRPTVKEILFGKAKLYIDAEGGTIGSTQITSSFLEFVLNVKTGWEPRFTGDGNLYFTRHANVGPELTLDITFEHDSNAVTEKGNWRNETARQIRINIDGPALGTAGTTYTYKTFRIDVAGKWENFEKIGDMDGNDILKGTFKPRYNSTASLFALILIVNELSALP